MQLSYIIIYVRNVAETIAFYDRAFNVTPRFIHDSGLYAEMETGATALAFAEEGFAAEAGHSFRPNRPETEPAGVEIAFVAEDVAAAFARAIEAGARSETAPAQKPWGQIVSYVRDCNGFLVEICSAMGE